jgi:long-subunit acyl-CoA synthetase (AMP-forming)
VLPGGKNVSPERVESVLSQARFVEEVLVVPGFWKDSGGEDQEAVKAIVRPAWNSLESDEAHAGRDLRNDPKLLKNILWQSISECQQNSKQLSGFEKISSQHLEIRIEEFQKTSTGKIKREAYMRM